MSDWSKYKVDGIAPTEETNQALEPKENVSEWDQYKLDVKKKEPSEVGSEVGGLSQTPAQDLPLAYEESKAGLFEKLSESIQTPQEKSGFRTVQEKGKAKLPSGVTMEKIESEPIDFDAEDRRIEAEQKEQKEVARLNVKEKYETIKPQLDEFKDIISQQKSDLDAQYNYTRQTLDELKRADQLDINAPDVSELVQNYDRLGKETEEKNKQLKNIENAELFVKDLENILSGKNKKFSEGVYQSTVKKLAFDGIAEIKRNFDLKKISDKIANGEDITADEQLAIASYGLLNEAQSNFQSGIGYDVGSSLVEMVPYLFSFAVTGGISKGIQAGVMSALKSTGEKTTKELVKKGVAYVSGQAVRPAFFSSFYASGLEKQIGQIETTKDLLPSIAEGTKESPQKAFAKAYANTMSEVMTEQLGEVAVPIFNKIIGKEVKQALNPTMIDKIKDATAFNGFLPEMGEEFANEVLNTAIEGRPAEEIFDPRKILTTALTVGIMSSGFALSNTAYRATINKKEQESGFKFDTKTKKQIDAIIESDKDTEEKAKELSYIVDEKIKAGAKDEEISNIVQYATSHTAKMKLDEVEPEIQKASEKKVQDEVKTKSEPKVSPDEKTPVIEAKGKITLTEKVPMTEGDKKELKIEGDNFFTRQINKDGEQFGKITVEESGDTWKVKDVYVDVERQGYGKDVYRQMNDMAQAEGKTIVSEVPGKKLSKKGTYMWDSLVNSGEAIKNEDGSYTMLPKKEIVEFANRIKAGEKMDSPEDLQFYENNKKSIESQLKTTEEPNNAERIPKTEGQVQEGGNVRPEGEGKGSPNLEQQQEAGAKAGDDGKGLTTNKAVHIENSPLTKKPDKTASIKEEKLLKEQKKKLMDDLYSIEDILAGENIDNVRKTRELVTKEKASLSVESEYEYNANNITPEIKKKLEKVGVKVKDGMFHIDIYKDGTAIVGSIDDAIGMVEKNFPMRMPSVKTGITGPRTKKFDARSEALDYKDFTEAEQRYKMAVENDKQAREKGTEGMKKFWGEKLVQEQQVFNEAKKIDYDELNKQRRYSNDKEYQEFFNENEDALEFEGVNRRDLYELLNEKGRPEKLSVEEVIPIIIKDKIEKSGSTIKAYENQLLQQITSSDLKLLDAFGRKDGKGLRQPKNNREESSLRVLKHLRDKAQHEYDDFKKYKKQLTAQQKTDEKVAKGSTDLGYSSLSPGNKTLDELAKERTSIDEGKDFLISDRVKSILKALGVPIAEKYLPKKYLGIFKHKSNNIRIQSIIDVVVATHEAAHYISTSNGIGMAIRTNKGMGKIREALTQIYVEFYPNAKAHHTLEKRVEEGYAVLLEHYFAEPTYITEKYPQLVNTFIKPDGKFYDPMVGKLLDEMNNLVDDYAKLSPEQKIGSRIIRSDDVVKKDKGFTWVQKLKYELFNRFEPFARAGKIADVSGEFLDPFVHAFQWMNRGTFIHDWIKGNAKMVIKKDGNWETRPGTVRDYLREVKGFEKEFDTFLVARRILEDYNNLNEAMNRMAILKEEFDKETLESSGVEVETGKLTKLQELQNIIAQAQIEIDKLNSILKNDGFNINDASAVVRKYENKFKKAVTIYDGITRAMIDFSENTGLITPSIANKYRESKGYAPFFRFINDELLPENAGNSPSTNSQTKAKIFKQRTGSKFDIVSPTYNQMIAISEVIGKGLENNIWVNVANVANQNEEIARRFEAVNTQVAVDENGNVSYPQDNDKNLIKVWVGGKRKYFKAAPEFIAVTKNLRGEEWGAFRKIIQIPSATFTRLTTSANPLFALGNITIDQLSAYMQSKTGFMPGVSVVDSFVEMVKSAGKINIDEETLFRKYIRLGGRRQTFAAFHELSPEKTISKVEGATSLEKAVEKMDLGLTALELPSNLSEYMTRFAEYKRAISQGKTETEAMFMASQITTPFQLYGNWFGDIGKSWIKALPYFNAAIQVNYKFFKTAGEQPGKVAIMSSAILSTALSMAFLIMSEGSDEQKRLLANLPARELARAVFFPNPWNKNKLIRIRVPENIGAFTGLAYLFVIQRGVKQKPRYKDYVDCATAFVPDQFNILEPKKLIFSWVPQVLSPSVETAANVKTYPNLSPIVPEYLLENYPPELQYTEYATNVAISMGKIMNVSPMKIDYWVRNQFGVVGGAVIGRMPNNPLVREEQRHVTTGRAYSYFYDDKVHSSQEYNSIENKKSYSDKEREAIAMDYVLYNKMGNVLSNMRRTIKANEGIPESIKEQSFELLIRINNGERGPAIHSEMASLNKNILDFVAASKIDIGREYNVTIEAIDESMATYVSKVSKQVDLEQLEIPEGIPID